jgi:hypothetical protein
MSKEKVFIVLSHKHSLGNRITGDWQVNETIEFVSQLRNRHYTMSTVIVDYLNRKLITGKRAGFDTYEKFDEYARKKYPKQMTELDNAYGSMVVPVEESNEALVTDEFGTVRPATVFD